MGLTESKSPALPERLTISVRCDDDFNSYLYISEHLALDAYMGDPMRGTAREPVTYYSEQQLREARAKAFEDALNALESYEKSFAIWPGKISLGEIKGWLLNRKASAARGGEKHE